MNWQHNEYLISRILPAAVTGFIPSAKWVLFRFNLRVLCFAALPVLLLDFVPGFFGNTALLIKARIAAYPRFALPISSSPCFTDDVTFGTESVL
jgi:hypothetical protein